MVMDVMFNVFCFSNLAPVVLVFSFRFSRPHSELIILPGVVILEFYLRLYDD